MAPSLPSEAATRTDARSFVNPYLDHSGPISDLAWQSTRDPFWPVAAGHRICRGRGKPLGSASSGGCAAAPPCCAARPTHARQWTDTGAPNELPIGARRLSTTALTSTCPKSLTSSHFGCEAVRVSRPNTEWCDASWRGSYQRKAAEGPPITRLDLTAFPDSATSFNSIWKPECTGLRGRRRLSTTPQRSS